MNTLRITSLLVILSLALGLITIPAGAAPQMQTVNPGLTNLAAWWTLDEAITNGTRNDSSTNVQHLSDNNTVPYSTGKVGNAISLTYTNSEYMSRADSANLSMGDIDFTIGTWVKATTLPGSANIIMSKGSPSAAANSSEYAIYYSSAVSRRVTRPGRARGTDENPHEHASAGSGAFPDWERGG